MRVPRVALPIALLSLVTFGWGQTVDHNAKLRHIGTVTLSSDNSAPESGLIGSGPEEDEKFDKPQITGSNQLARVSAAHVPTPAGTAMGSAPFFGFSGLNNYLQATAYSGPNGYQFNLEPPDLGLAAGNGFVVETVNNAIAVYDPTNGTRLARAALNYFFGLAPAVTIVGSTTTYGPFVSDPRAFYDWQQQRFYVTELMIERDPVTGNLGTHSAFLIAVSQTADPTGLWDIYSHDTSQDGDSRFGACPCFGDQPLVGFDANGIYVSTNAFSITDGFRGAQVYAIDKNALLTNAGGSVDAVRIHDLNSAEGPAYSIQPATTPPGGTYDSSNGGTEYFMSALDYTGTVDNRLAVWALTNTSSLADATPSVSLQVKIIGTQSYGMPPDMQQKDGPLPLRDTLRSVYNLNNHLELVTSNDDRMQQVVYAAGKLWTGLTTAVQTHNGPVRAGAAWFIVSPSWSGSSLNASVSKQGYLAINSSDQNNVAFPSIGVNANGMGAISVTVVGQSYYPSTAIAPISLSGAGALTITGPGPVPDDGFSGYAPYGYRSGRWGDYSSATADENGNIWLANANTSTQRTIYANWSTFITKYTPQ
ncbi:MAG TPA: hypothetical protein VF135_02030 [Terriglobales bacterium]